MCVCVPSKNTKFCFDALLITCSRDSRENCSLLKEEVEGLRKKLERMEKMKEDLVNMEHEKEARVPNILNGSRSNGRVQIRAFSLVLSSEDVTEAPSVGKSEPVYRTQHQVR